MATPRSFKCQVVFPKKEGPCGLEELRPFECPTTKGLVTRQAILGGEANQDGRCCDKSNDGDGAALAGGGAAPGADAQGLCMATMPHPPTLGGELGTVCRQMVASC